MKSTLTLLTALLLAPLTAIHAAEITPNRLSPEETQRFGAAAEYSRAAYGGSRQELSVRQAHRPKHPSSSGVGSLLVQTPSEFRI